MTRVLVTGSDQWTDMHMLTRELDRVDPAATLVYQHRVHTAPGNAAAALWEAQGRRIEAHPVDWHAPCRREECGHHRRRYDPNTRRTWCPSAATRCYRHIIDTGLDMCLAFVLARNPSSITGEVLAARAGVDVHHYHSAPVHWTEAIPQHITDGIEKVSP